MAQRFNGAGLDSVRATERTFDRVLRGYNRSQVDEYTKGLEAHLTELATADQQRADDNRVLYQQLHQAQMELLEARRAPQTGQEITYKHFGLRIEQILTLAHEHATAMESAAADVLAAQQAEQQRASADLRELETRLRQEMRDEAAAQQAAMDARVAERQAAVDEQAGRERAAAEALMAEAHALRERIRLEGQQVSAAAAVVEREREEWDKQLAAMRLEAERDANRVTADAELYSEQIRTVAEEYARQTRQTAQESAATARIAAERDASQLRLRLAEESSWMSVAEPAGAGESVPVLAGQETATDQQAHHEGRPGEELTDLTMWTDEPGKVLHELIRDHEPVRLNGADLSTTVPDPCAE